MQAQRFKQMTFSEANNLLDEATDFLISCGGIYHHLTGKLQENILFCLANGQYIAYRDGAGHIEHFLYYWNIEPAEVEDIESIQPINRTTGSVLYIVGHGNKAGNVSMRRAIRELRERSVGMSGLIYNHKGEGMKAYPHQKGA